MTCKEFRRLQDAYLDGKLDAGPMEAFERHYFCCDDCFRELQIDETLRRQEVRIAPPLAAPRRLAVLRPALGLAATLLVVVGVTVLVQQRRHAGWLERVSRFDPPLFIQSETRAVPTPDPGSEASFRQAMEHYNRGAYPAALAILEPLRAARPGVAKFDFFAGLCRLLAGDPAGSLDPFDAIIRTMDPSYFDEAEFYKGIALLRLGRIDAARSQFARLSEMFSPMSGRAREMVGRIEGQPL